MGKKYTLEEAKKIFKDADCELLETEYINNYTKMEYRCSCGNISKILMSTFIIGGRCKECVYKRRYKFRNIKKTMTKQLMQIFDGLMISDAYLRRTKGANENSRFCLTTSKREFAEKVMDIFSNFPWSDKSLRTFDVYDKRTDKSYSSTVLRSRADPFFTEQRNRWYPYGKKIVPKDIKIDRDMLLWWYIGDGFLYKKKSRPNYRRAYLATDSFSIKDVNFLIGKLKNFFKEENTIAREKRDNEIYFGCKALCKFANLLGSESPVVCYNYKFDFGRYFSEDYYYRSQNERNYKNGVKYISKVIRKIENGKCIYAYKY